MIFNQQIFLSEINHIYLKKFKYMRYAYTRVKHIYKNKLKIIIKHEYAIKRLSSKMTNL